MSTTPSEFITLHTNYVLYIRMYAIIKLYALLLLLLSRNNIDIGTADLKDNALCILLQNATLSEVTKCMLV